MNSWITNALTSQRTTIGGIITAVGAALLGAEAAGIQHVPDWLKLCGLILSAVGPVILGTQARQGNVTSEQVKAASAPKPPDYLNLGMILCLIGAAATFSGCLTLPALSPNGQSGNTLVAEKDVKPDGEQHFKIAIKQHGEATKEGTIDYSSGGPDPATFRISGNASVDSSRLKPLLEGEGAALAKLPDTVAGLADILKAIPDAAPGTPGAGLKEQIVKAFIERLLGRVLHPEAAQ